MARSRSKASSTKKPAKPSRTKASAKPAKASRAKKAPRTKTSARKPAKPSSPKKSRTPNPTRRAATDLTAAAYTITTTSTGALSPIELRARKMLDADAAGDIDNVFDEVNELDAITKLLPKKSALYPDWKRFYDDCCRIMGESVGM